MGCKRKLRKCPVVQQWPSCKSSYPGSRLHSRVHRLWLHYVLGAVHQVDSDFRLVLRKMAKRDALTGLKMFRTLAPCANSRMPRKCNVMDLSHVTTEELNFAIDMMLFLSWVVTNSYEGRPVGLSSLLCVGLAADGRQEREQPVEPWVQLFVRENAALIVKLSQYLASPPPDVLEKLPLELATEWADFFVLGIYSLLLPLPVKIEDMFTEPDDPVFPLAVLESVSVALTFMPHAAV